MAASYWTSSHGQHLARARAEDSKYASKEEIGWLNIWSANVIHKLAKRLSLRQQVTATAITFFRRFYSKNSYCATCLYVAAKAEELPVHIKSVVNEARLVFQEMGFNAFPSDNSKIAEMEFYLLEDLEFHLIVHHPYRSLVQMTGRDSARRENMMDLNDQALQMAWFIINDIYRTELCLLYPPHILAIAALYMALSLNPDALKGTAAPPAPQASESSVLHVIPAVVPNPPPPPTLNVRPMRLLHPSLPARPDFASPAGPRASPQPQPTPGAASSTSSSAASPPVFPSILPTVQVKRLDPVTFLSRLNVSLPMVMEVVQEITSSYVLWKAYESITPSQSAWHSSTQNSPPLSADERVVKILARMREAKAVDVAHPSSGRPQK